MPLAVRVCLDESMRSETPPNWISQTLLGEISRESAKRVGGS